MRLQNCPSGQYSDFLVVLVLISVGLTQACPSQCTLAAVFREAEKEAWIVVVYSTPAIINIII